MFILLKRTKICSLWHNEHDARCSFCSEHPPYANYTDPSLLNWEPAKDQLTIPAPVVFKTDTHHIIYCLYLKIVIDGQEGWCPPYTFTLPITVPFELPGASHNVTVVTIRIKERALRLTRSKPSIVPVEDSSLLESLVALKQKNDRSITPNELNVKLNTLTIPMNETGFLVIMSFVASIVTIWSFLKACIANPMTPSAVRGDTITKIYEGERGDHSQRSNNQPLPPPKPDSIDMTHLAAIVEAASARHKMQYYDTPTVGVPTPSGGGGVSCMKLWRLNFSLVQRMRSSFFRVCSKATHNHIYMNEQIYE